MRYMETEIRSKRKVSRYFRNKLKRRFPLTSTTREKDFPGETREIDGKEESRLSVSLLFSFLVPETPVLFYPGLRSRNPPSKWERLVSK